MTTGFPGSAVETTSQTLHSRRLTCSGSQPQAKTYRGSQNNRSARSKLAVAERFVDFLEHGDDLAVARMRAYKLADDWKEPRRGVLEVCCVRRESVCSTSNGTCCVRFVVARKRAGLRCRTSTPTVHCETCKIDFIADFDRYVELTFRPNPAVRRVEIPFVLYRQSALDAACCRATTAAGGRQTRVVFAFGEWQLSHSRSRTSRISGSTVSPEGKSSAQVTLSNNGWSHDSLHVSEQFSLVVEE